MQTANTMVHPDRPIEQITRFGWHFVQMFVVMMLGMVPMGIVLALLGIRNMSKSQPELFAVIMTIFMVLPMVAWMRFQMGHGWARTTEMSLAMVAPTVVLVPLCLGGVLPHGAAVGASMMLMPLAMLADMGYRWREYAQHQHRAMTGSIHSADTESATTTTKTEVPIAEHEATVIAAQFR